MPASIRVTSTNPVQVVVQQPPIPQVTLSIAQQGPPGPPGPSYIPDPATLADGRMVAVQDGEYIDIAPPAGTGDMQTLIYDPRGFAADAFNLSNLTGSIDGGVFT